jgi:CRP-like cAMP-binding protein
MGVPLSGLAAWVLWRSIYLAKIPGRRKKLQIAMDWISEWLFPRDITVLDIRRTTPLKRAHYRPGDIVFRQGEIGDSFYMIQTGMVEILRENDGGPEQRLGIRTAGESFGEVAIMKGIPRTATVRCLTSVNLIMLSRQDFSTLVGSSHMFRHQIDETLAALTEDLVQTESNAPENL